MSKWIHVACVVVFLTATACGGDAGNATASGSGEPLPAWLGEPPANCEWSNPEARIAEVRAVAAEYLPEDVVADLEELDRDGILADIPALLREHASADFGLSTDGQIRELVVSLLTAPLVCDANSGQIGD